jgi:pyruvate,water dikinase
MNSDDYDTSIKHLGGEAGSKRICAWFNELSRDDIEIAGGKGSNLGDLACCGLPIPPGFVILSDSYIKMTKRSGIDKEIKKIIATVDYSSAKQLQEVETKIRKLFDNAPMTDELRNMILDSYRALGDKLHVAVRSSSTAEDLALKSFAGQHESYLNVVGEKKVLNAVLRCWSSLYTSQTMYYRHHCGFDNIDVSMAVVVQKMINAEKSGVAFTVDPVTGNRYQMMIEAVWGLGEGVVSGSITPDNYKIDRETFELVHAFIPVKEKMYQNTQSGDGVEVVPIPVEKTSVRVLSDQELTDLVKLGNKVEHHFGNPQDIEWGIEAGSIYILQSRAITTV